MRDQQYGYQYIFTLTQCSNFVGKLQREGNRNYTILSRDIIFIPFDNLQIKLKRILWEIVPLSCLVK